MKIKRFNNGNSKDFLSIFNMFIIDYCLEFEESIIDGILNNLTLQVNLTLDFNIAFKAVKIIFYCIIKVVL